MPRAHVDKDYYSLAQYLIVKDKASYPIAVLRFTPTKGWKWNKKYPARFEITGEKNKTFSIQRWHVEYTKTNAVEVWLKLEPKTAQSIKFTVQGRYSFCDSSTCAVFKRRMDF